MRTAPAGWPTDFRDTQPTVTVLIDGAPVQCDSYSINRTASSDIPEGLKIVAGVSTASAEVVINTAPTVFSFQRSADEFLGKVIQIYAGYSGVEIIMFTGLVYNSSGRAGSYEVTLSCDDTRIRARKLVTIPFVCRDMPEDDWTELSGQPDLCGLSTLWVADRLMRAAGIDSFPVYRLASGEAPKILFRVSNQGGWVPEYGTIGLITAPWNTVASGVTTPANGWGVIGTNGVNWYNCRTTRSNGTTATIRISDWVRMTACVDNTGASVTARMTDGSTHEDYFRIRRDATTIYAERRTISTNTWSTDASLPALPGEFYIVSVIWRATNAAGQMTAHMIDNTGRTTTSTAVTRSYGSHNRISRMGTSGNVAFIDVVSSTIGNAVAAHPGDFSWSGPWIPGFKALLPQLGSWDDLIQLYASPSSLSNGRSDAWNNMRDMAQAEAALLLVNEEGQVEYRARSWVEGATAGARLTAAESLTKRDWSISMDQIRRVIEVEYETPEIQRAQRLDPVQTHIIVGRPTDPVLIDGGETRNVFIDLDGDSVDIDLSLVRASVEADDSFWYMANVTDTVVWDGTNANNAALTGVTVTASLLGSSRVLAKVVRAATGVGTYTLAGRKGAPNSPSIRARDMVQGGEGGTETRGEDPDNLYQPFTASQTQWRQGIAEAAKYADWLESKIDPSLPQQSIEVIPDLLMQIGDIKEVEDPDDSTLIVRGGILGITTTGSNGSMTQSIDIRPIALEVLPPEEEITFDEFDLYWSAGNDFDDLNAYLDAIDPTMTIDEFSQRMRDGEM